MLKRSHDHRYTPVLDLAQLGAIPPPDKELVMPRPSFSGSEMVLTFWSFLFEGRVAEESLEDREFQGRLRRYNQLNILVSAKVKPNKTTLVFVVCVCVQLLVFVFLFLPTSVFCCLCWCCRCLRLQTPRSWEGGERFGLQWSGAEAN